MVICAAADTHYPRRSATWAAALAEDMCHSGADVLVLAGDVSVGGAENYAQFLGLFQGFGGPKLFVPGNHDLWSVSRRPDTRARYDRSLRRIVRAHGFHYLPGAPRCVGNVGFVGTAGWYDYSFRQTVPPVPGLRVRGLKVSPGRLTVKLPRLGDEARGWEELTEEDYAGKALMWEEDERLRSLVWYDGVHVDWRESDAATVARMAQDITLDATELAGNATILVGVSHFLPFAEFLAAEPPAQDVGAAFCRAYLGSPVLGAAFLANPGFRLVLCGHLHAQKVISVGEVVAANCSVGDPDTGPLLLTLPEA